MTVVNIYIAFQLLLLGARLVILWILRLTFQVSETSCSWGVQGGGACLRGRNAEQDPMYLVA